MPEVVWESFGWQEGFFRKGETRMADEPRGHAIRAIKRELEYLGTHRAIKVDVATYGDAMLQAVKDFQKTVGLTADGVIGPVTAKALFHARQQAAESRWGIPNDYACRMTGLESGWYPAARNTGGDVGLVQINLRVNEQITEAQAYDPAFSLPWAAERLAANRQKLSKAVPGASWTHKWHAAVFAHNAPAYADDWLRAGCPATGGDTIMVAGKEWDMFEWATLYVTVVLSRAC